MKTTVSVHHALMFVVIALGSPRSGLLFAEPTAQKEDLEALVKIANTPDYIQQVELLKEYLVRFPESVSALNQLGYTLYMLSRNGEAIDVFVRSIELDEKNTFGYQTLGRVYLVAGSLNKAAQLYQRMVAALPEEPKAGVGLGMVLIRQDKAEEGKKLINKALEVGPADDSLYGEVAHFYVHLNDFDEAVSVIQRWKEALPESFVLHINEGHLYWHTKKYPEAEKSYLAAVRLGHEDIASLANAHHALGFVYLSLGRYDDAMNHFRSAVQMAPGGLDRVLERNQTAAVVQESKSMDSLKEREKLASALPSAESDSFLVASILVRFDHYLNQVTKTSPPKPDDLNSLSSAGRDFINSGPGTKGNRLNFVAYSLAEKGVLLDEAVRYARESLELAETASKPEDICDCIPAASPQERQQIYVSMVADTLGWALFRQSNIDEAIGNFRSSLKTRPEDRTVRYHFAKALEAKGQESEALEAYVQSLDPGSKDGQ